MVRYVLTIAFVLAAAVSAHAGGINRFPFRSFDDVRRPKTAQEVRISYQMVVSRQDGIDRTDAKLIALYALVDRRMEIGYQLANPRVVDAGSEWKVTIPSEFSINKPQQSPALMVCVDKQRGKVTCFGPEGQQ